MKFEKIEPVNQIKNDLFVRHKVEDMAEGDLIQKCIFCGEVIEDYTPKPNSTVRMYMDGSEPPNKGMSAGYLYINKSVNTQTRITQEAITLGFCSVPKEFIDCTIINS